MTHSIVFAFCLPVNYSFVIITMVCLQIACKPSDICSLEQISKAAVEVAANSGLWILSTPFDLGLLG